MRENRSVFNWTELLIAGASVLLAVSQLLFQFTDLQMAEYVSRIAFLALCLFMVPKFTLREWLLILLAGVLIVGLLQKPSGVQDGLFALDRAAFFAAFIYLVTLLKEAAQRSASVLSLGKYLTRQPPGRRYYSIAFGGHIMGVLLNFGAVSLLAPLIQRGAKAGGTETDAKRQQADVLEQQQLSALVRGFSWMILWAPTALTQVVLFTSIPDVELTIVITVGVLSSLILIFLGRIEDRFKWRHRKRNMAIEPMPFPGWAAKRFFGVCAILIGATFALTLIADVSPAIALMLVAPLIMAGWLFEQVFDGNIGPATISTLNSLGEILAGNATTFGRNAFVLGTAGFIGVAAAQLAPVSLIASLLETFAMPDWLFLVMLPLIINLCGQVAISPIIVVVFLGSVMAQLPEMPANPSLIAFSLAAGWALSMTASPNASATLLISGITGIPATTLTWRWNRSYALMCLLFFVPYFYILTKIIA